MSSPDELPLYLFKVYGYLQGAVVSAMVCLGAQLGLYRAMAGAGPLTAADLAERTSLHPRWVLEWLRSQGAAGIVAYHGDGRFELTDLQASVLADEEHSPVFAAAAFEQLPDMVRLVEPLRESFRTGIGLPYDAFGESGNHAMARSLGPWNRHLLVPVVLPALDGVVDKLQSGAKVADVGCGAGVALLAMAEAFPASEFHGYELSAHALVLAERNREAAGVSNVTFHPVRGEDLPPDNSHDFITSFDCIHDMTRPQDVISAVRGALRDDGTYLIVDIKALPTYEENVEVNPMVAMMYSMSVLSCMSSATSEPGGAGLGTLGFHTDLAEEMTRTAGFTRFAVHDFENPINVFYEVRP
jgi:2-polyprenyl-3-methyl-5-hydroxy-6-metoxy-1,4-benzoquinol methylase